MKYRAERVTPPGLPVEGVGGGLFRKLRRFCEDLLTSPYRAALGDNLPVLTLGFY
jgi:hypothetical protein